MLFWRYGLVELNGTILFTWIIMAILAVGSWLITRRLSSGVEITRWQNMLEAIVSGMQKQLSEISRREPRGLFPFVATLFLFIAISNLLSIQGSHSLWQLLIGCAAETESAIISVSKSEEFSI